MTGEERADLTMHHKKADRVPVMCQLSLGHIILNSRFSPAEFIFDNEVYVDSLISLVKGYDFDGTLIGETGRNCEDLKKRLLRIENLKKGQMIYWNNGARTWCPEDDYPWYYSKEGTSRLFLGADFFQRLSLLEKSKIRGFRKCLRAAITSTFYYWSNQCPSS